MAEQKKAAIYVRVSTDAQAEEGYSIDAQKEQLSAYCVSKRISRFDFYVDGGWSGSNMDRPQLRRMIQDAKDGKLSHCIVYKLDRLSRSQKDTLYLIEDVLNPNGVEFVSLNENLDTSTAMGRAMIGILSAFAQLERENIRMRTRMGMKERVKEGLWMGGGRVPYGYDYDQARGILVPNADADKVRRMYELYLEGRSPGKIAELFGLKYDRLVVQILQRKSNYGVIEYKGEIYQGRHEPLISKEMYDRTMAEMKRRSFTSSASSDHLLTGLVYCGRCSARMRYVKWGKNGFKLACYSNYDKRPYLVKDPGCTQETVWADEIEELVLQKVFSLKKQQSADELPTPGTSFLEDLKRQRDALRKKIEKLYNLYGESEDDVLLDTIRKNQSELKKLQKQIRYEEDSIQAVREKERAGDILDGLESRWPYMTKKERQTLLRKIVAKVTVTGYHVHITLNI